MQTILCSNFSAITSNELFCVQLFDIKIVFFCTKQCFARKIFFESKSPKKFPQSPALTQYLVDCDFKLKQCQIVVIFHACAHIWSPSMLTFS